MSFNVKDFTSGEAVPIKSTTDGGDQVPHHIVDSSALPDGAATEASLAALLNKVIAAPATEASLAAILAKIIAAPATEAKQDAANVLLNRVAAAEYETVAASQTAQTLGATGAAGDFLSYVVCFPQTTSPGVVTILDNATVIGSFPGGAGSVGGLNPFTIPAGMISVSGAWKITTGANIHCIAVGDFT